MKRFLLCCSLLICLLSLGIPQVVSAQTTPVKPFALNSFSGTYYLSRDAQNHSLLTVEEVIIANFSSTSSLSGITRALPRTYQGRSVDIRIQSIQDASGQAIPYKTAVDKDKNLVITTGDPAITLYGTQTFRIKYQTRNVVNLSGKTDEFLLNVNGRGWSEPFGQVTASVHIPNSFNARLSTEPTCTIGLQTSSSGDCTLKNRTVNGEKIIDVKSNQGVPANASLIVKFQFQPDTFSNKTNAWSYFLPTVAGATAVGALVASAYFFKSSLKKQKIT
jgi:hypothetical protein